MASFNGDGKSQKVSVIVCVRNGAGILRDCLASIEQNIPKEIIVVDGMSTDETVAIAESFPGVKVISDKGKGLAYARRIGIENASGELILFVGPDNIMENEFIENFVRLKNQAGWNAASVQTRVLEPKTFWDKGLDFRWQCLMGTPGPLKVVGTPSLYEREMFNEVKFSDQNMGPNDDTDVADQLLQKGYRLGLVPLLVYDQNGWTAKTTWNRFKWYGTGDFYYYNKYRSVWNLRRRWASITHPLRQTAKYVTVAAGKGQFAAIAWLTFVMFARYSGWIGHSLRNTRK